VGSSGSGLRDLSLVGNGVLVWDHDVLGTNVSVGSSGLGGELGVRSGSLGSSELSVLGTNLVSSRSSSVDGSGFVSALRLTGWNLVATSWGTLESDSGSGSDEGSNDEFHF